MLKVSKTIERVETKESKTSFEHASVSKRPAQKQFKQVNVLEKLTLTVIKTSEHARATGVKNTNERRDREEVELLKILQLWKKQMNNYELWQKMALTTQYLS